MIKQTGSVKIEWKKASDIVKVPDKYKIYIQPIGMNDLEVIQNAVPKIEEFWGCRVEILPTIHLPEDPLTFSKDKGQYNCYVFPERAISSTNIPKDSIFTEFLINKDLFHDVNFPPYRKGITKVGGHSLYSFRGLGNIYVMSDAFATRFNCNFAQLWCCNKKTQEDYINNNNNYFGLCDNPSCTNTGGYKDKRFAICEECQKKLKNVDFDEFYDLWRKMILLREFGPEEKKWVEDYRIKVQEALKKAEAEKIRKSQEKVDFLPSVELVDAKPGISCDYYEFEKDKVKNTNQLMGLHPQKSMTTPNLSIAAIDRKENFALAFSGFIKVPVDDIYTFYLSSDYGSSLVINDLKIIDNNGTKGIATKTGKIALNAGFHPIRLSYFQGGGDRFLELYWRSEKHLIGQKIPGGVLFHK